MEDRTLISSSYFCMLAHHKHAGFDGKKRKNALIGARQSRALGSGEQVDRPQDDGSQPDPDRRVFAVEAKTTTMTLFVPALCQPAALKTPEDGQAVTAQAS